MAEERERANPKYILRRLRARLPAEITGTHCEYVIDTVEALYAHCNSFLYKDELDEGIIHFDGECSFSQIAEFCRIKRGTAKWRCEQLRDRWDLMIWRKTKYGIAFVVGYGKETASQTLADSETANHDGLSADYPTSSELVMIKSSELTGELETANHDGSETANHGLAPLSLNCQKQLSNDSVSTDAEHPIHPSSSASQKKSKTNSTTTATPQGTGVPSQSRPTELDRHEMPAVRRPIILCETCGRWPASPEEGMCTRCLKADLERYAADELDQMNGASA